MGLPNRYVGSDQVFPKYFYTRGCAHVGESHCMSILSRQLRMIKLLRGRLRNIPIHCSIGRGLFCAVGLHNLARNLLLTTKNGGRCSVLPIDNREVATAALIWHCWR